MTKKIKPSVSSIKIGTVYYSAYCYIEYMYPTSKWAAHAGIDKLEVYNIQRKRRSKDLQRVHKALGITPSKYVYLRSISANCVDSKGTPYNFPECKRKFELGGDLPFGVHTTPRAAILEKINYHQHGLEGFTDEEKQSDEYRAEERALKLLKGLLTKLKK